MVKKKWLHFVQVGSKKKGFITASQHRKKSVAKKKLAALKKKGIKATVISKKDFWVY